MISGDTTLGGPDRAFPKTVMDLLSGLRDPSAEARQVALGELGLRYWKPVYTYIRLTWPRPNEEAKDLAQGFFLWLLEGDRLKNYDRERSGFRTYLKLLLKHFVNRQDEARECLKRGGGRQVVPLGADDALPDPGSGDPERLFDRAWRRDLLDGALERVRRRYNASGKSKQFQAFEEYDLRSGSDRPTYGKLAEQMGLKVTDVHNYLFAIREEIREEVRAEISRTTSTPDQFREEWNAFIDA
jgi:DNA-directed RNA polymerase specialized sigma24 family protein